LGSYIALTNAKREVVQRNCFNPWGDFAFEVQEITATPPNPKSGNGILRSLTFPLTRRGFTGHEHYPEFKIINMNGRLYDPVICRFFSPDNFVQIPEFTQSFNRYSYCLNNPLKYTDPSGQWSDVIGIDDWLDVLDDYGLYKDGRIRKLRDTYDNFDQLIALDNAGKETNKQIKIHDRTILPELSKYRKGFDGTSFAISESTETGDIYMFVSQNSNVEWGLAGFHSNGKNEYIVYTDHNPEEIRIPAENWIMFKDKQHLFGIHSHPTNDMKYREASGFGEITYGGDMAKISEYYRKNGVVLNKYVYHPYSQSLIKYDVWNPQTKITPNITYPGGLLFLYKK
jgi:RHS repeat-associated protein